MTPRRLHQGTLSHILHAIDFWLEYLNLHPVHTRIPQFTPSACTGDDENNASSAVHTVNASTPGTASRIVGSMIYFVISLHS